MGRPPRKRASEPADRPGTFLVWAADVHSDVSHGALTTRSGFFRKSIRLQGTLQDGPISSGAVCLVRIFSVWSPVAAFVACNFTLALAGRRRPSPHIHLRSFGRFDEILYLVENASALTLPDFERRRSSSRCDNPCREFCTIGLTLGGVSPFHQDLSAQAMRIIGASYYPW